MKTTLKELHDLYSSPNIFRLMKSIRMRWVGHVARMRERRIEYRALVGRPDGGRQLGRPRRRRVDNIKIVFQEVAGRGLDWSGTEK